MILSEEMLCTKKSNTIILCLLSKCYLLHFSLWCLVSRVSVKPWVEQHFTQRRDRGRQSFSGECHTRRSSRFLLVVHAGQLTCTHPSCAAVEGLCPHPAGTDIAVGLTSCHMTHTLKQNKAEPNCI